MNLLVRFGLGCAAGAAATALMDPATEMLYTEEIARREREIQPESSAAARAPAADRS